MNYKIILLGILLSALSINYSYSKDIYLDSLVGIWEGNQVGDWKSVYEIYKDKNTYAGISHEYYLGIKESENNITEINTNGKNIIIKQSNGLELEFQLSEDNNVLTSTIELPETTIELSFNKVERNSIKGLLPYEGSYNYQTPKLIDDGWKVSSLGKENIDSVLIYKAVKNLIAKEAGIISSLVIVKNKNLVLEEYFYGHDYKTLHPLSSVTKSISSLAVGLAIDKDYIYLNDKIYTYFPEVKSLNQNISVQHVLEMKAGFIDEQEQWRESDNVLSAVLSRPTSYEPGEKFHYDNGTSEIIPGLIKEKTEVHLDTYMEENIFNPLQIKNYDWEMYKSNGYPSASGSLRLTPRDMAKIGQLMLNKGVWNNKQIISESWIENSIKKHSFVSEIKNRKAWYGFQWWICESQIEDKKVEYYFASGFGSKFLFIIPSLDMVVIFTGGNFNDNHFTPIEILEKYLIKAAI